MPTTGPSIGDVHTDGDTGDPERLPYALVKVTPQVLDVLTDWAPRIATAFTDRRPPQEIKLGI
jgi:polysaccharide biosynthesis/export protein